MAAPTLGGVTLNGTEAISVSKTANIIPLTMPTGDSDETEVFDLLGVLKTIAISGSYSGTTVAATKAFVASLEALANGNQAGVTFNSDQTGSVQCMVAEVVTEWEVPGFKVEYNIKIIQGTGY